MSRTAPARTVATTAREQKILEARRLRTLGWTAAAIGRELGVPESTLRNWYLGGTCVDCGTLITYDSPKYKHTKRCVPCEKASKEAQHGTLSKYKAGCSCDACRAANRENTRQLKGKVPPHHGCSGYKNYGCRCQTCRDGNLVYMRSKGWEYQRAYDARARGTEPPQHGTETAYNKYGCRCDLCRAANTAASRRRRQNRRAA